MYGHMLNNMNQVQRWECSVHARATNRMTQLPHTFWMGKPLGAAMRQRQKLPRRLICSAMDASMGGSDAVFPRLNERDPYKRLGVTKDAGEEEVEKAFRNLSQQYSSHAESMDSIASAYDEVMVKKLREPPKLEVPPTRELPTWVQKISHMYQVPNSSFIAKTAAFYALMGLWTALKPLGEGGPAFQVLISFVACIYFLNLRVKSLTRSLFLGFGAFVIGWVLTSFFIPAIPPYVLPAPCSLELTSSLISYTILWAACTFLR